MIKTAPREVVRREPMFAMSWVRQAQRLQREAHVFYFAFKCPRVPWYARLVAVCTAGYLFSPIQIIPNYIPVIGFLDDFVILFVSVKLLQRFIPADVLTRCRQLAETAEAGRKEKIRSAATFWAIVAIASLWLLGTVAASSLMVRYILH
jgi:uncharacterized membrane protein YkvA (DUF1232 family)